LFLLHIDYGGVCIGGKYHYFVEYLMNSFQGDPYIVIENNGATFHYIGGNPIMDQGLENQALISLFTKQGWPGNFLYDNEAERIGSDFEELSRGPITLSKLALIEKSAENALAADIFGTVTATATNPESWIVSVNILISPPGGREFELNLVSNGQNWINQAKNPAHKRV
jgi:phage gp46-like protein